VKKIFVISLIVMFAVSTAFAVDFVPTLLKISAPETIQYDFDDSTLEIPVTISGTPSTTIFLVYTKDQASGINDVVNGYLGWHTVNKVDTCIFASQPSLLDVGSHSVNWNGKDQDGNTVAADTYTYYLWGFDSVNMRTLATPIKAPWCTNNITSVTRDFQGNALPKPVFYSEPVAPSDPDIQAGTGDKIGFHERQKWVLGGDPLDLTLIETTRWLTYWSRCSFNPSPYEADMFFDLTTDNNKLGHISKWTWVPNGIAEKDLDWGDGGEFIYSIISTAGTGVSYQEMRYVGGDLLAATQTDHYGGSTESELVMVSALEGEEVFRIDLSEWWISLDDAEAGGQGAAGPKKIEVAGEYAILCAHGTCMTQMIVPTAGDEEEDFNRWVNMNGDYTNDKNFSEDSERPWVCNDYNAGPYAYQISPDSNLFSVFPAYDIGAVSIGLFGPDGTGLNYFTYAGETAAQKYQSIFIDDDTAYDGLYTDFLSKNGVEGDKGPADLHFVGHDSIKGIITNVPVAVEEAAPSAFAVKQNSPNPFNPSTTISFTIAESGNVAIDVFNVAGQKVDTIASEFMSAGSHSLTWDASGFSAGVYFYTVKSGELSKTMKMTLLK